MNREELIRKLQELAQELGKETLTQKDIKASEISVYWIGKHFGNMASALEAAGLQPSKLAKSMATSDDELLDYLDDLQRRLGQRPTYLDIDRGGRFSQRIFTGRFGSLENALSQLRERQVSVEEHPAVQPRSREELIRRLQDIAQQHGDKPLREKDIKAYGLSPYWIRKHFKNVGSALQAAGLQPSKLAKSMATSDDELLDYLDDLQRRLGRRPIYLDIDGEGRFSQRIFTGRFGSLENALSQLKERQVSVERRPDAESPSLTNKIIQAIQDHERDWQQRLQDAENRARTLEQRVGTLQQENEELRKELNQSGSILSEVTDNELKKRLHRLGSPPLDTLVREACVTLEDRLGAVSGSYSRLHGVDLVDAALTPGRGTVILSSNAGEQEGVKWLFRGALQYIRNPATHRLHEYPESKARLYIRVIDFLLQLLSEVEPRQGDTERQ
jgi:SMC interacting uncharacterized protein involved in chromosome segregation